MEAWNIYISVLTAHYPARSQSLLAYQRIICDASLRFPSACWLRYDARFRACAAEDKSLRWDVKNNDLWLECFTQHSSPQSHPSKGHLPTTARTPCTYCGNLYHYPDNCPHNPFRPSTRATVSPAPKSASLGARPSSSPMASSTPSQPASHTSAQPNQHALPHICRDFNFNKGSCTRPHCRFRHVCTRCGDISHGQRDCTRPPTLAPHPAPPY